MVLTLQILQIPEQQLEKIWQDNMVLVTSAVQHNQTTKQKSSNLYVAISTAASNSLSFRRHELLHLRHRLRQAKLKVARHVHCEYLVPDVQGILAALAHLMHRGFGMIRLSILCHEPGFSESSGIARRLQSLYSKDSTRHFADMHYATLPAKRLFFIIC